MKGMVYMRVNEKMLDEEIRQFQEKFGVVEEGTIVSDDDYEYTLELTREDMGAGGGCIE